MTDVVSAVVINFPVAARASRVPRPAAARAVIVPTLLLALAGWLVRPWWLRGEAVPLSWARPPVDLLTVLPAVPVIGLLALRVAVGGPGAGRVASRLTAAAARWSFGWAAVAAVWLVVTVVGLYGSGVGGLVAADNLPAVLAASATAGARLSAVWVALLVALLGARFDRRTDTVALLVLVAAAALAAAPSVPVVHDHAASGHVLVQLVAAVELLALLGWVGAAFGAVRLPRRTASRRAGALLTAAASALGLGLVVAGTLRPDDATPAPVAIIQAAAVALVVIVGHRHRERLDEMITEGSHRWASFVGDAVVLVAVVALGCVLPLGV